jgi:CcmD family protein
MENLSYLFAAYSIIFAAIAIYVWFVWRRQARLEFKLSGLELRLNKMRDRIAEDSPEQSCGTAG